MEELIETATSGASPVKAKADNAKPPNETTEKDPKAPLLPLSELFKKDQDSWDCGTCYVNNKKDILNCLSCSTPKPGHENDQSIQSVAPADPNSSFSKFSFGFGLSTPPNLKAVSTFDSKTSQSSVIPEPWVDFDRTEYNELASFFK